jgi:hypothetical protein
MIREENSELVRKARAATEESAADVLEIARRHNTPIIVWRNGRVVELDPNSQEFDNVKPAESSESE